MSNMTVTASTFYERCANYWILLSFTQNQFHTGKQHLHCALLCRKWRSWKFKIQWYRWKKEMIHASDVHCDMDDILQRLQMDAYNITNC